MRRFLPLTAAVAFSALATGANAQERKSESATLPPELESVRGALDKYRDPIVAVHDGYFSTLGCINYPKGGHEGAMQYPPGGMGVHFLNVALIGPTLDPANRKS